MNKKNIITQKIKTLKMFKHNLSHLKMYITPILIQTNTTSIILNSNEIWYDLKCPQKIGIPIPVTKILTTLT